MVDHANSAPDELVELREGAIWPERDDDGNRRKVVALAEHLQLHDASQIPRVVLEALPHAANARFGHGVVQVGRWYPCLGGYAGHLFCMPLTEGAEKYPRLDRVQKL